MNREHNKNTDPCKSVLSRVYSISVGTESDEIFPPGLCNSSTEEAELSGPVLDGHPTQSYVISVHQEGRRRKKVGGQVKQIITRNINVKLKL